uniref:Uncharacterized protein n=1 Tax=Anguilla anguilla TaxID=7936 RepID=A0A0E9VZG6_ANGAN
MAWCVFFTRFHDSA